MRILHFTNIQLTPKEIISEGSGISSSGGWMATLLGKLYSDTDFTIACAAFGKTRKVRFLREDRLCSFVLPTRRFWKDSFTRKDLFLCRDLVREWNPDLIHVHGTENIFGLLSARRLVECPVIISLQGLLGPCSEWYHFFGNRTVMDVIRMHRFLEIPSMRGQLQGFFKLKNMAKKEREIITGNRYFIGRTDWDRAYIQAKNRSAKYYQAGEILRHPFKQKQWAISYVKRHQIIFINAGHPRKGFEVLLEAVHQLRSDYPNIKIRVAGRISPRNGYGRYIRRRFAELGNSLIELGALDANQMTAEMLESHVFVSSSFIENSSNSICEAQLLGMPVISSYTGGVPSLIKDGHSGLFFPTGDSETLAAKLRAIFENDGLAARLGSYSRAIALKRHEPVKVIREMLAAYEDVLQKAK